MKSRSATAAETRNAASVEGERPNHKRPYNRKSLICRLCLRVLPKNQLPEIFAQSGNLPKVIQSAVATEVSKKDRSIRICVCCLDMVKTISDFRATCERAGVLFTQNLEIPEGSFWTEDSDQKIFGKCRTLVEEFKIEVDKHFTNQLAVICDVQKEDVLEESTHSEDIPMEPTTVLEEEHVDVEDTGNAVKVEPEEQLYLEEEHLEEQPSGSEHDFVCSDVDDPDFVIDDQCNEMEDQNDDEEVSAPDIKETLEVAAPRRRRGRPCLPEELLKRRKRKPGEPKRKPGPKGYNKPPPQSICEICGVMVNRENQERHRNEHLGNRPYVCTIEGCSHAFTSKAGLHGHLARHADRDKIYDCDICGAKIKTKSSLHRHKKLHTAEKPHGCDICGKRFWRKSYLNHHATVHTGVAKFPCEYCGFVFKNKYWRSFHIKQKHVAKGEAPKFEALEELAENEEMAEVLEDGVEMGQILE